MIYGWRRDLQPEIIILESLLDRGILQHTDDNLTSGRKRCIQTYCRTVFQDAHLPSSTGQGCLWSLAVRRDSL